MFSEDLMSVYNSKHDQSSLGSTPIVHKQILVQWKSSSSPEINDGQKISNLRCRIHERTQ